MRRFPLPGQAVSLVMFFPAIQAPPDSFQLVYDARAAGYTDWWFPALGTGMLIIFSILLYFHLRSGEPMGNAWVLYVGVPFLALWVVGSLPNTYGNYASMRDRLKRGDFTTVTGVV